jgi:hypothetical protein
LETEENSNLISQCPALSRIKLQLHSNIMGSLRRLRLQGKKDKMQGNHSVPLAKKLGS